MKRFCLALSFLTVGLCSWGAGTTRVPRRVSVANGQPFMDHITMNPKTQENDLIVKFDFNEEENSFTVSLISYRSLFVFEDNTRFSKLIPWYSRKFNPDKLSYPIDAEGASKYAFSLELFHRMKKKGKKYVFKPWISYTGMQLIPTEYKMINDYIEQKFNIDKGGLLVTVHLHDLLVMDEQIVNKKRQYVFVDHADLDKLYSVEIHRNPCFKMDTDMAIAKTKMETIKMIYTSLNKKFLSDTVATMPGGREMFEEQRILTLKQNPKEAIISDCPDIQMYMEVYNSYVDSISALQCEDDRDKLEPEYVLAKAKEIDINVAKWQISKDESEKADLIGNITQIIKEINRKISKKKYVETREILYSIEIFENAVSYFEEICEKGIADYEKRRK